MKNLRILFRLGLILCLAATARGRGERRDDPLPSDARNLTGRLDNGLAWIIRPNPKPEKRVELRLVVNAGSVLEADDQKGLAHLLEHMAFNGSKNFPRMELVKFLESLGVGFGPDLNAYTSFDQTVYLLQVPTHEWKNVEKAFLILEDWAFNLTLDEGEINKERLVVQEEWRRGRNAERRIRDLQFPVLFHGSRYADRLPIGDMEVIAKFPAARLRDFYRDWYRPELMTVIVAGDITPDAARKLITRHFGPHKNPPNPPARPRFDLPAHADTLVTAADDPEAVETSVGVFHKMPGEDYKTVGDYRRGLIADLASSMLAERFDEIARREDAPFLGAHAWMGSFLRSSRMFGLGASAAEGAADAALRGLATEAERARRHGFTPAELERAKKARHRAVQSLARESGSMASGKIVQTLVEAVTMESVLPSPEDELKLHEELLPGIRVEEVNEAVRSWLQPANRVVMADGPRKPGLTLPAKEQALGILSEVEKAKMEPWHDDGADTGLMPRPEKPGEVASRREIPELGITVATLSNGVTLWLKPTDFKQDQVLFKAFSPGGLSMASDTQMVSARNADELARRSGWGKLDAVALRKALAGHLATVAPEIEPYYETLSGGASPEDLETLFQLVHLAFTSPRQDAAAFQSLSRDLKAALENRLSDPAAWFADRMTEVLHRNHPLYRSPRLEDLPALDPDAALEFYRGRFADADDFTFVLVGSFKTDEVLELARSYLATLPVKEGRETWRDPGVRLPARRMVHAVEKGLEPVARVRVLYTGPLEGWDPVLRNRIQSVGIGLDHVLREAIREELGGTYDIHAMATADAEPALQYQVLIDFGCDPKRVDELIQGVRQIVARVRADRLPREVVGKIKETQIRRRETLMKTNEFWASFLQYSLQVGQDPKVALTYEAMVRDIERGELRDLARTLLDPERESVFILRPEPAAP